MKKDGYKSLDDLVGNESTKVPLSTRVKPTTKSYLEAEAKKRKLTVSKLASAILDDYHATVQKK